MNLNQVALTMSAGSPAQFPRERMPQVALSGRSNVGKSSLINTLLNRKSLARVSSAPGKTITVNFYAIDSKMYLVDLPGYGYAKRSREDQQKWSQLTDGYFSRNPSIDLLRLVVQLIDIRVGVTEDDAMMLRYLTETGLPFLVVATKTDKLSKTACQTAVEALKSDITALCGADGESVDVIPFSSVTRVGKEQLWSKIRQAILK